MLFWTFFKQDRLVLKGWVRTHTLAKLGVMGGFLAVILGVMWGVYAMARSYFIILNEYPNYGQAVVTYAMQSGLLLILIIGILTSTLTTYPALYKAQLLRHWLTLPVEPRAIFWSLFGKMSVASGWSVMVVLLPVIAAYFQSLDHPGDVLLRGIFVTIFLVVLSQQVGSLLSILGVKKYGRLSNGALLIFVSILIFLFVILGRILFPPALFRLTEASDWNSFQAQINALPLSTSILPTAWLAKTLIEGWSGLTLMAIGLIVIMGWWLKRVVEQDFVATWYKAQARPFVGVTMGLGKVIRHFPKGFDQANTLMLNDLISILRSSTELVYLLFVFGLGVALYLIIRTIPFGSITEARWLELIYISVFVGFNYLVTVLTSRFSYPLMTKEAKALWFLFSAPVPRLELVDAKLCLTMMLLGPWLLVACLMASAMNLPIGMMWLYAGLMMVTAVTVGVIQVAAGIIAPNFPESERPDAVSTSGSGLGALGLSLLVIAGGAITWNQLYRENAQYLGWYLGILIMVITCMVGFSIRAINKYEKV
jgi:hypothetical protein